MNWRGVMEWCRDEVKLEVLGRNRGDRVIVLVRLFAFAQRMEAL